MILDPEKSYADVRPENGIVANILTGYSEMPDWAMKRRRLVEIPEGVTVQIGDVWTGGNTFRGSVAPSVTDVMWQKIQQKRDLVKIAGVKVTVEGVDKWFHSDDASRIQHIGLVLMGANMPSNIQWKTMDGSFVTMTPTIAEQIFFAVAVLDMGAFAAAETHRAAMTASQNPADYDFSGGWPQTYE